MNRKQAKKLLPIIEAFANGEEIQFKDSAGNWENSNNPMFYDLREYRIKPKPREFLIAVSGDCCVLHSNQSLSKNDLEMAYSDESTVIKVREVTDETDM